MRPRHKAAENVDRSAIEFKDRRFDKASMRPRHKAAENKPLYCGAIHKAFLTVGINEAAA